MQQHSQQFLPIVHNVALLVPSMLPLTNVSLVVEQCLIDVISKHDVVSTPD